MKPSDFGAMKDALSKGEVTVGADGKVEMKLTPEQEKSIKRRKKAMREHDEGLVRSGQACPNCGSENCATHKEVTEVMKNLPPGTPIMVVGIPVPMRPGKAAKHKCLECGRPEEEHSEVMCPTPRWGVQGQDED
jgi:hypothetical protein